MTAAEAVEAREQALAEVEVGKRRQLEAGLMVLRQWAARGRPFSANDVRAELREIGVEGPTVGALFAKAKGGKVIRSNGYVRSTDPGTHGKPVAQYVAANRATGLASLIPSGPAVGETVPVVRDGRGRFTSTNDAPTPEALFDLEAVAR